MNRSIIGRGSFVAVAACRIYFKIIGLLVMGDVSFFFFLASSRFANNSHGISIIPATTNWKTAVSSGHSSVFHQLNN